MKRNINLWILFLGIFFLTFGLSGMLIGPHLFKWVKFDTAKDTLMVVPKPTLQQGISTAFADYKLMRQQDSIDFANENKK